MALGGLTLVVEVIAGTSVASAACALVRLADRIGIQVAAKHNDVEMLADPGDTAEEVMRRFKHERRMRAYPQS